MTGADEARDGLVTRIAACKPAVIAAINALRGPMAGLTGDADLSDAMRAAAETVLAAEALEDAAKALAATARATLAETMDATGATGFRISHHTVSVSEPKRGVLITGDVPAEFLRQPPPAPDKHALHKALSAGITVPGATLSNGGAPTLTFRQIKKDAA